jgi:hypothetical protein
LTISEKLKIKITFFLAFPPPAPALRIFGILSLLESFSFPLALSLAFSFSVFP